MFPKQQMILSPEKLATFFDPSLAYVQMQNLCKLRTKTKKWQSLKAQVIMVQVPGKKKSFFEKNIGFLET